MVTRKCPQRNVILKDSSRAYGVFQAERAAELRVEGIAGLSAGSQISLSVIFPLGYIWRQVGC